MRELSVTQLSQVVKTRRKALKLTQAQLAKAIHMNRTLLSRLESGNYTPSMNQLLALSDVLQFDIHDVWEKPEAKKVAADRPYRIAVAGMGYVGLSLAVLLAQHNDVTAVDIVPEKVEKLNRFVSPIQDEYIERYLAEAQAGLRRLHLTATTDGTSAYRDADYVVIAAPTNYDPKQNFFDCSAVETVIRLVLDSTKDREQKPTIVIKSTIPVGYTEYVRKLFQTDNILFSPEFLRESKALYDNLFPSRIIVGCDPNTEEAAHTFATLLQQGAIKNPIETLDEDTLETINRFFENNLNVSETSRKLYVHRNTLVYRLEKIKKITGLDLREFDHAIVFKVAMMVKQYLDSLNTSKY